MRVNPSFSLRSPSARSLPLPFPKFFYVKNAVKRVGNSVDETTTTTTNNNNNNINNNNNNNNNNENETNQP